MNSLFLRIYWGMLASLLIVGCITYLIFQAMNTYRYEGYRQTTTQGAFHILMQNLTHLKGDERYIWLSQVNEYIGTQIELKQLSHIKLAPKDQEQLVAGEVVFDVSTHNGTADAYLSIPGEEIVLKVQVEKLSEKQARGQAKLLLSELKKYPQEQWKEKLAALNNHYGFPLKIENSSSVSMDPDQLDRLKRGDIVVNFWGGFNDASNLTIVIPLAEINIELEQIGSSDGEYLVMGPIPLFDWFPYELFLVGGVISLISIGLAGYFLVRPLESGMTRMEKAINRIRRGDLSARAYVDTNDALGHLATTINDMAEHLQRLIKSQREMTNAVSHELRTPVARIRFGLEIIEDSSSENKSVLGQIKAIDNDIEELEKLIDEILTYANLEEGRPALKLEAIEIQEILSQVRRESLAAGHSIAIELVEHGYTDERRYAECEHRYIHRVTQNLVNNAVRYAKSKVRISCSSEGGMYRIDVEDDGPGIPQDKWETVFTPFARLDSSRNRKSGGYGLGLSIVKSIAYWHGGVAGVYFSSLGGVKFTIIWPRKQGQRVTFDDDLDEQQKLA